MGFDISMAKIGTENSIFKSKNVAEEIQELNSCIPEAKKNLNSLKSELLFQNKTMNNLSWDQQIFNLKSSFLGVSIVLMLLVLLQKIKPRFLAYNPKNIDSKKINLFVLIWSIFHLLLLINSKDILIDKYTWSWKNFWVFTDWESYMYYYDISEFVFYALFPVLFIFGRRYLRGEKLI